MHFTVGVVWDENDLTICEAVVTVHGRRDRVWQVELGRVADERGSQVDAVVEEWRVMDGSHRKNDVVVGKVLTRFPLNDALVRTAHVHHFSCNEHNHQSTLRCLRQLAVSGCYI